MLMSIAQKCNGNNKDAAAALLRQVAQLLDGQKTKIPASERIVQDLAEYTNELSKDKTKKGQLRLQQLYSVVVPHLSYIKLQKYGFEQTWWVRQRSMALHDESVN